jgi:hypothetical protein
MTAEQYKAALATLDLTHDQAAAKFKIGRRTSVRYAIEGVHPGPILVALDYALAARRKGKKRKPSAQTAHVPEAAE